MVGGEYWRRQVQVRLPKPPCLPGPSHGPTSGPSLDLLPMLEGEGGWQMSGLFQNLRSCPCNRPRALCSEAGSGHLFASCSADTRCLRGKTSLLGAFPWSLRRVAGC